VYRKAPAESEERGGGVEGDRMDIHKPKAAHSLREFLIEIGTIICGILIALALEQAIVWLTWRHDVAETRQAIKAELAYDLGVFRYRVDQSDCVARRVADLHRWEDSWKRGEPLKAAMIAGPSWYSYYTDAWAVAETGQVAAHIPLDERIKYAQIYGQIRALDLFAQREHDNWHELADFNGADQLDRHDLMRLRGLVSGLARENRTIAYNLPLFYKRAAALGIKPSKMEIIDPKLRAVFCGSLFAAR
jgi:hypothetical protein